MNVLTHIFKGNKTIIDSKLIDTIFDTSLDIIKRFKALQVLFSNPDIGEMIKTQKTQASDILLELSINAIPKLKSGIIFDRNVNVYEDGLVALSIIKKILNDVSSDYFLNGNLISLSKALFPILLCVSESAVKSEVKYCGFEIILRILFSMKDIPKSMFFELGYLLFAYISQSVSSENLKAIEYSRNQSSIIELENCEWLKAIKHSNTKMEKYEYKRAFIFELSNHLCSFTSEIIQNFTFWFNTFSTFWFSELYSNSAFPQESFFRNDKISKGMFYLTRTADFIESDSKRIFEVP